MKEQFNQEKENWDNEKPKDPLVRAYELVHGRNPGELERWEIARQIVEALDNPDWVPVELARQCVDEIVNGMFSQFPDDETRIDIVSMAERMAGKIFPELAQRDEIHMADIERAQFNRRERDDNRNGKNQRNKVV